MSKRNGVALARKIIEAHQSIRFACREFEEEKSLENFVYVIQERAHLAGLFTAMGLVAREASWELLQTTEFVKEMRSELARKEK